MIKKIGITGGIGSGKSMICQILEHLSYPVFYSDEVAKNLVVSNLEVKTSILNLFGPEAYLGDMYNVKFISNYVFEHPEYRGKLNQIIHPAVYRAFDEFVDSYNETTEFVFCESALLFETGSYKRFDNVVLVYCDLEERIRRVQDRNNLSRQQVLDRINSQIDQEKAKKMADFIIDNSGKNLVIPQLLNCINYLKID